MLVRKGANIAGHSEIFHGLNRSCHSKAARRVNQPWTCSIMPTISMRNKFRNQIIACIHPVDVALGKQEDRNNITILIIVRAYSKRIRTTFEMQNGGNV